jgi:hypothetical protein
MDNTSEERRSFHLSLPFADELTRGAGLID